MHWWFSWWSALADLVLPRCCVGCRVASEALCPACRPRGEPVRVPPGATYAAGSYDGAVRAALLRYKERGRRDLGPPLGALLGRSVAAVLAAAEPRNGDPRAVVLVPVPSSSRAAAARDGDHLRRLSRHAARQLRRSGGGPDPSRKRVTVRPVLALRRQVRDSAGLGAHDREANVAAAMVARSPACGSAGPLEVAVLVDDIVTTGATLTEARRALAAAGWPVLGNAVVAATPRRTGRHRRPPGHGPAGSPGTQTLSATTGRTASRGLA